MTPAAVRSHEPGAALSRVADRLRRRTDALQFGARVACVYNPLDYARAAHRAYLQRHARTAPRALLVGMNPGPWGMVQTGVPFGDPALVRDWLGIEERVGRPSPEHPARPVLGFDSTRREGSGRRLWGWARRRFGTPAKFFRCYFILNYCPLCFFAEDGRNLTPDRLGAGPAEPLFAVCDEALRAAVEVLRPGAVVGIGRFAARRVAAALDGGSLQLGSILHPSPASPLANRGWEEQAQRQLQALGLP